VCTVFLVVICVTGLPLIFGDEISDWLDDSLPYANVPVGTPNASLDQLTFLSRQMYPGEVIIAMTQDDDEPKATVFMAPSWKAFSANRKVAHWIRFDARTAQVLKQSKPLEEESQTFLGIMLRLHKDLFAGLPGELFLGLMAALFVVAIVSGVAIYGPFMRKLDFGTVRVDRSPRLKWLDLHNMLGIVTLAWGLVVGGTGVINQLTTPLLALWQQTDVRAILEPLKGRAVPAETELSSPQAAYDKVRAALPGMTVTSVIFPGASFGSPYHYFIWTKGQEPLTSRLFSPVLVDARSGKLESIVIMPWYLRALQVSRPLHFGDYGGLPLKVIWVLLDLVTIAILGSGIYLWLSRRGLSAESADVELVASHMAARPMRRIAE
jgi:uncharacterized iron-regulated membrane protein